MAQRKVERISQSAIEITAADIAEKFSSVRGLVLNWLSEKAGSSLPEAMLNGETSEFDVIGAQRVETAALPDRMFWAARQDDQSDRTPGRTWVTEAAIASPGKNRLIVGHRLHCVSLSEEAPFSRSIPKFMRQIAQSYTTLLDGSEISLEARVADTEEEVDVLVGLLLDRRRAHPVIGISSDPAQFGSEGSIISGDRLAAAVFGTAHVWLIGREAAFALSDRIGRELSVFNGAVRSWRYPFSLDDNPFTHPLALAPRIQNWGYGGPRAFYMELVDWALRLSAGRADADQLIPPFSEVRRTVSKLAREKADADGKSDSELLQMALQENALLTQEISDQKSVHDELLKVGDVETNRIQKERDEALAELARLRLRMEVLSAALQKNRAQPDTPIPADLSEIEDWASEHLGDGIKFLGRALSAAKKSPFEDVAFVYRTLIMLRDVYVPMRRNLGVSKADCDLALAELGLEITPTFSGAGAGQYGDLYKVRWTNNEMHDLDWHIKGSNSREPRFGFRIYFFWDEPSRAMVIGFLPGHLRNDAT